MCIKEILKSLPWATALIQIREIEITDAKLINEMDTNIRVRRYMGILNNTVEELEEYISNGKLSYIMIDSKHNGESVGYTGYVENEEAGGTDILVCISPDHQKRGYAEAALNLMAEKWENQYPEKPITVSTSPENKPARKLLERCSFRFEKEYVKIPNFDFKMTVYVRK